jgi:HK97 family phage prohead protease
MSNTPGARYTREATLGAPDGERVPVVVSTEFPVDRGDIIEILDHALDSVDLARAPLPVIEMHDLHALPIGIVEDLGVDPRERVLRGFFKPGTSSRAQEIFADIKSGVIRSVSVGYELVRQIIRTGRIVRYAFRPFEVSVLAVPADPGAGFFRTHPSTARIAMNETTASEDAEMSRSQRGDDSVQLQRSRHDPDANRRD